MYENETVECGMIFSGVFFGGCLVEIVKKKVAK